MKSKLLYTGCNLVNCYFHIAHGVCLGIGSLVQSTGNLLCCLTGIVQLSGYITDVGDDIFHDVNKIIERVAHHRNLITALGFYIYCKVAVCNGCQRIRQGLHRLQRDAEENDDNNNNQDKDECKHTCYGR